ncbi:MAG TPA: acetoacetate--CoA ligase [Acidimicrobiia bacterium]|nr:acetoacetate--CoA ligase [Acidimicrobiia bacterium]
MSDALWTPAPERVAATNLRAFAAASGVAAVAGGAYPELHEWSVREPTAFWRAVWGWAGVVGEPGEPVVEAAPEMWRTRFFPDARLNFAENLLRAPGDVPAILFAREDGARRAVTRRELHELVSRIQQALLADGVRPGDRVAALVPNVPEVYALMLAATSIGATFSSCSPDFGVRGVLDRFGQIEPVVLVAVDGYVYEGKRFETLDRAREIRAALPTVRRIPVLAVLDDVADPSGIERGVGWDDWLAPYAPAPVEFTRLPFDHPVYVLYSSGTTGLPKCIVHRAGGVLLKHLVEHRLHCDVRDGDRVLYFTTTGWMMWNWLASALASDAAAVVYDGSPAVDGARVLWDLADEVGVTLFGTSAKFLDACHKQGLRPAESHSLASVRTITSTGSPLSDDGFRYVYEHVKPDVHLASISGGTDLCGCLVAGDPTGPVYAGEIQRPGLGMAIEVFDDGGAPLGPGAAGELVCTAPFPSIPLGLWDDPGDERLRATYFERFPGVWHQGDYAEWTEHGGVVIHGRSDATLNPGGVRIGTAEIYRQVETIDAVVESLVIGQEWDGDVRAVLFVVLRDGAALTDELAAEIRARIRNGASPRHVPARILAVDDLPRTRSGKLTELAVRDVVHGRPVKNVEALANPEALDRLPLDELRT